jgi:tRNA(Arg) A34 adenosine deaminase TadA
MANHEARISEALAIARSITATAGVRVAALLVDKKEVISVGWNELKTHPLQKKYAGGVECKITLHAEISAIASAVNQRFDRFKYATLYVARAKWDGPNREKMIQGNSKPCYACSSCIAALKVGRVIYTLDKEGYEILS